MVTGGKWCGRQNAALPFVSQWKSYGNGKQNAALPFVSQWKSYGNGKQMAWPPKRTSSDSIDVPLAFPRKHLFFDRSIRIVLLSFKRIFGVLMVCDEEWSLKRQRSRRFARSPFCWVAQGP
jgi:hypothetical protein